MYEYRLTIKKAIKTDDEVKAIIHKKGEVIQLSETDFYLLKKNKNITKTYMAGHGYFTSYTFDKYNFENEVEVTEVILKRSIRKLGQRKKDKPSLYRNQKQTIGFTKIHILPRILRITHGGNMGASFSDVDENLQLKGFPTLSELKKKFTVISEKGHPEMLYDIKFNIKTKKS